MKKNIKLIPLFLFLFVFQLLYFLSTIYTEKIDHIFLILAVFMILNCILLYCVLSDVLKKSNTEMELAFLQKQKQLKQEQDYSLQIRRQDTRDFQTKTVQELQDFQILLEQGKYEQADTVIRNLNQTFQKDRFHPYCQNNLLQAILEGKRLRAEQEHIHILPGTVMPHKRVKSNKLIYLFLREITYTLLNLRIVLSFPQFIIPIFTDIVGLFPRNDPALSGIIYSFEQRLQFLIYTRFFIPSFQTMHLIPVEQGHGKFFKRHHDLTCLICDKTSEQLDIINVIVICRKCDLPEIITLLVVVKCVFDKISVLWLASFLLVAIPAVHHITEDSNGQMARI